MSQLAAAAIQRVSHNGWKQEEVQALRSAIERANQNGEPLRGVFDNVSRALGRKPNSIRNYYYAQMKNLDLIGRQRSTPFKAFKDDEVRSLLKSILEGISQGMSVRSCVVRLAEGDKSRMLRYQNKYRSVIRTKPDMVRDMIGELEKQGIRCRDPFHSRSASRVSMAQTEARLRESDDPALQQLLIGLNSLLSRSSNEELSLAIERMQARQDILMSDLSRARNAYQELRDASEAVASMLRTFLEQPGNQRRANVNRFCGALEDKFDSLEKALGM